MSGRITPHDATGIQEEVAGLGITRAYGTTKPTDEDEGFAPSCIFQDIDSGAIYVNVGTKASANFDVVSPIADQDHVADVTITATLTGVDTGTDMTAAQAATIVTDLTALATAVNAILSNLESAGIHATS